MLASGTLAKTIERTHPTTVRRALRPLYAIALLLASTSCITSEDPSTKANEDVRRRLESLAYLDMVPVTPSDEGKTGVNRYEPEKSYQGLNLFNSRDQSTAKLMTMDGEEIHTWTSDQMGRTFHEGQRVLSTKNARYLYG